jgi:hypothetical protein
LGGQILIFVDTCIREWLKKYPGLTLLRKCCDACGKEMVADRAFLETGYAGLAAHPCSCGQNRHTMMSLTPTRPDTDHEWRELLAYL